MATWTTSQSAVRSWRCSSQFRASGHSFWREQTKSIAEQFVAYVRAEELDQDDHPDSTDSDERGEAAVVRPKNALIQQFLGIISSVNAELFVPIDPRLGLRTKPNPKRLTFVLGRGRTHVAHDRGQAGSLRWSERGVVGEAINDAYVEELNRRTP
jgi:hypothetical protein